MQAGMRSERQPVCDSHENADSTSFSVRGLKYAVDRKKEKSNTAFYQCDCT